MNTLIIICAWCKKFIDLKDGDGVSGTSHTICPDCQHKVRAHYQRKPQKITQRLDPVKPIYKPEHH